MAKYYVTVATPKTTYKVCRNDIKSVFSCKLRKAPKVPSYYHT